MSDDGFYLQQQPVIEELVQYLALSDCIHLCALSRKLSKLLDNHEFVARVIRYSWKVACQHGLINVVRWMHENNIRCSNPRAMDTAASNGWLELVRWLHENGKSCTKDAMDLAAGNGHLHVVQWLHENRTEGCSEYAMEFAAHDGHLHILQWLHENRPTEQCSAFAIANAMRCRHKDIVAWLLKTCTFSEQSVGAAMDWAKCYRYCDIWFVLNDLYRLKLTQHI